MIFLISLAIAILFVLLCGKTLKQHPIPFYLLAVGLSVLMSWCALEGVRFPDLVQTWVSPILSRGGLAGALFVLVMFAGAVSNRSQAIRILMPIRAELSILACILTLGHNIAYGQTYFKFLLTDPGRLPPNQLAASICSVVMLVIMLPLFITSFRCVRKKMKAKTWKKLQRSAYVFYALLYVHIMLLTVPYLLAGRTEYAVTVFAYSAVFVGYAVCRVMKAFEQKKGDTEKLRKHQVWGSCGATALAVCLALGLTACGMSSQEKENSSYEEPSVVQEEQQKTMQQPEEDSSKNGAHEDAQLSVDKKQDKEEQPSSVEDQSIKKDAPVKPEPKPEEKEKPVQPQKADSAPKKESKPSQPSEVKKEPTPAPEAKPTPKPEEKPVPEPPAKTEEKPTPPPEPKRVYKNGTFSGSAEGYAGTITVSVTIQDDVIKSISITDTKDDEPFLTDAKAVISSILSKQSTDVSAVSGATFSSEGIRNAVKAALNQAKN